MRIESLELRDFRGIRRLDLQFPEQVTVLVGVNGAGKSAILDCAAIMLSRLTGRVRSASGPVPGRHFAVRDIRNGAPETANTIRMSWRGRPLEWRVSRARHGRQAVQRTTNLAELRNVADHLRSGLAAKNTAAIPIAAHYSVNRSVLDIPLRVRKRHEFDQLSAYDHALTGAPSNFRVFFEWFRNREDLENETRVDRPGFRDSQLEAVRTAIRHFLPGFKDVRIRRSPLRMEITKKSRSLTVNQLSDGEKCSLALAGDIARRLAIANPAMRNPLNGDGIVLIDEIDLHLHPGWQRRVTDALREAFPNCQFLLSTHSPQILSHLKPKNILLLQNDNGTTAAHPHHSFGQETNRILEDLMEVPARPREIIDRLGVLFQDIEQGKIRSARKKFTQIFEEIGPDPALVRAEYLIRSKEIEKIRK